MEKNLKEKTGRTLNEWKALLAEKPFVKHGDFMSFLKGECGVSHGYANFIAHKARETDAASQNPDDLIEEQYQDKADLKPIFDKLKDAILQLAPDIAMAPKKTSVSFRRQRQFALVKPTTKSRIDLGLKFNDRPAAGRLEPSGPFGTMCTHRVQLTNADQVDAEILELLRDAAAEAA